MKTCNKCSKELPLSCFRFRIKPNGKSYTQHTCNKCYVERRKQTVTPEQLYRWERAPARRTQNSAKVAQKRGLSFTLTVDQYMTVVSQPCFYCNNQLSTLPETSGGLDRIDNSRGYELDNVLPACVLCNKIRGEFSVEEGKAMVKALLRFRNRDKARANLQELIDIVLKVA